MISVFGGSPLPVDLPWFHFTMTAGHLLEQNRISQKANISQLAFKKWGYLRFREVHQFHEPIFVQKNKKLGGGFIFLFSPPTWRNEPIWLINVKWVWNHQIENGWRKTDVKCETFKLFRPEKWVMVFFQNRSGAFLSPDDRKAQEGKPSLGDLLGKQLESPSAPWKLE